MPSSVWRSCASLLAIGAAAAGAAAQGRSGPPIAELEVAARADSNDASNQYLLALGHWQRRRWDKVDSLLRLSVRLDPRFAEGYLALYFLPFARRPNLTREEARGRVPEDWRGPLEEANRFYQLAFRTNPLVSLRVLGVVYEIEDPSTNPEVRLTREYQIYYAWFVDLGMGRYGSAYDRLRTLGRIEFGEEKKPRDVPDWLLWYRGLAAAHSQQYAEATRDFRGLLNRALAHESNDSLITLPLRTNEFRFMLAAMHHVAGQHDSAIALYKESLAQDLGLVTAHTYLAGIYEDRQQPDSALLERRRAAESNPDDPVALFDYAGSLARVGRLAEAKPLAEQAIQLNDRYAAPYYLLARIADVANQPAEAKAHYQRFLATAPLRYVTQIEYAKKRLAEIQ